AFGRPQKGEPLNLTILLPANISFDKPAKVFSEATDGVATELTWRKCVPGGCFADIKVSADLLKRWRTAGERGRIELRNANGQDIGLPISLRGFSQAMDALPTE
ncbi:MAG: invasion protein, partial [Hyphomicrobiales bacterium]|nr:invasion protein [Hyphomicrobiales bacterium]